jgi:hypothetical protein
MGESDLCHVDTRLSSADMFTKNLPEKPFRDAMERINIVDLQKIEGLFSECESCDSMTDIADQFN